MGARGRAVLRRPVAMLPILLAALPSARLRPPRPRALFVGVPSNVTMPKWTHAHLALAWPPHPDGSSLMTRHCESMLINRIWSEPVDEVKLLALVGSRRLAQEGRRSLLATGRANRVARGDDRLCSRESPRAKTRKPSPARVGSNCQAGKVIERTTHRTEDARVKCGQDPSLQPSHRELGCAGPG
jgi:hypothetical protein